MPPTFTYRMYRRETLVGLFTTRAPLYGKAVVIPELSALKEPYNTKMLSICVPLKILQVEHDTYKIVLDVSRKSKRQIDIIKRSSL